MSSFAAPITTTAPDGVRVARIRGAGVVLGALAVTTLGQLLTHTFGHPTNSIGGEFVTETVAGLLGYVVAFGLGWWRPARSSTARTSSERTAVVVVVLGALLVPVCFWNPMPATFAAAGLLLVQWGRSGSGRSRPVLARAASGLAALVVAAQIIALVVHVIVVSGK
jgi:hypothetical protein